MAGVTVGGHFLNTSSFQYYKRLGVNTVRMFCVTYVPYKNATGSSWGLNLSGAQVSSQSAWQAAVKQLRTPAGHDPAFTKWAKPNKWNAIISNIYAFGKDPSLTLAQDLQNFRSRGLGVELILPSGTCGGIPLTTQDYKSAAYWQERWELYRIIYVVSRFAALNGVVNIETMNEPDGAIINSTPDRPFSNAEWLDQLTIRSAAVRAAYADQGLKVTVKAGPFAKYGYVNGSTAQLTGQNAYLQFPTVLSNGKKNTAKGPRLFDVFAYNMYGATGQSASAVATATSAGLLRDTGSAIPLSVGEYSAYTAKRFDTLGGGNTTDLPIWSARWAAETAVNLQQLTSGSIAFTFGTNSWPSGAPNSGVKKNCLHWTETSGSYRVGDTVLAAEATRLLFTHAGGSPIMLLGVSPHTSAHTLLVVDGGTHWRVFSIIESAVTLALDINFSAWGVPPGGNVTAEEVSATRRGELGTVVPFGGETYGYSQPGQSLVMFSVPKGPAAVSTMVLQAAADTTLFAGSKQGKGLTGAEPTLLVRTSHTGNHDVTSVALLRFDLGNMNFSRILSATLSLTVASSSVGPNYFTILGINGWQKNWTEAGLTWSHMPNLAPLPDGVVISTIGANFVNWLGTNPQPQVAGHVSPSPADATAHAARRIDVTDFIVNTADPGGSRTLLIYRPFRHAAYGDIPADSLAKSAAAFYSAEAPVAARRPTLTIQYR